jgi:flagellar biosynthesis/type III secretory pathway M-ring protein FliF/YscJ
VTAATAWSALASTASAASTPDPESVSPGLWGFAVVFVLAVVVWLLMRNMTGHLRRLRFREEERQRREAAERPASERDRNENRSERDRSERDRSERDRSERGDDEPPGTGG